MRLKIAILLRENGNGTDAVSVDNYLIGLMVKEWKEIGINVEILCGTSRFVQADILINHVDLTVLTDDYRHLMDRYPVVINRHVLDISKSKISDHILKKNDNYADPVIVKTDRNFGGMPEKSLASEPHANPSSLANLMGKIILKLKVKQAVHVDWAKVDSLEADTYPVYDSLHEVPEDIFNNKNLIVEKFLPEVEGDNYCIRYYFFFGGKEINFLLKSKDKHVKGSTVSQFEEAPVPSELRSARERLKFDYGKFDYVIRDGRVVLFDVNRTPGRYFAIKSGCYKYLAEGIFSKLK